MKEGASSKLLSERRERSKRHVDDIRGIIALHSDPESISLEKRRKLAKVNEVAVWENLISLTNDIKSHNVNSINVITSLVPSSVAPIVDLLDIVPNLFVVDRFSLYPPPENHTASHETSDIAALIRRNKFPNADQFALEILGKSLRDLNKAVRTTGGNLLAYESASCFGEKGRSWINGKPTLNRECERWFDSVGTALIIADPFLLYDEAVLQGKIKSSLTALERFIDRFVEYIAAAESPSIIRLDSMLLSSADFFTPLKGRLELGGVDALTQSGLWKLRFDYVKFCFLSINDKLISQESPSRLLATEDIKALRQRIGYRL